MDVDEIQAGSDAEGNSNEAEDCSSASPCADVEDTTAKKRRVKKSKLDLDELLKLMVQKNASDLHLTVPSPPILRIDGSLAPVPDAPPLDSTDVTSLFKQATITKQRTAFKKEKELDFAYSLEEVARFRVNALLQRGSVSLAFRRVLVDIPSIEGLGLPVILKDVILKPRGLVLVTGPANSGKSTTMAAMIRHLNENASKNVITIEDPVEYLHPNNKCIIRQRDLGDDTLSFHAALVHALRHDPDVVIIGEMRDLDTISTAMTAAETGHLVLGTLHTVDAAQSIDRIIDMYPFGQQQQVRLQLSQIIEAVVSQALLPRIGGGRVAAVEIMLANNVIRRLIRDHKIFEVPPNIEMGSREGMQTLDMAMADLVKKNLVSQEAAMAKSSNPARLNELLYKAAAVNKDAGLAGIPRDPFAGRGVRG
jgi:twitching motility protein PilT